jgi:ABC-type hemin transport system ATPase subunit
MEEAQFCDRLCGMLDGRIVASGAPSELLESEEVRRLLALTVPEAFLIAQALTNAGLQVSATQPLETVADAICRS